MTRAAKRESFCRRMQAMHRVQEVASGKQREFQDGQADAEWADYAMSGLLEEAVQKVQGRKAGQSVESPGISTPKVS